MISIKFGVNRTKGLAEEAENVLFSNGCYGRQTVAMESTIS